MIGSGSRRSPNYRNFKPVALIQIRAAGDIAGKLALRHAVEVIEGGLCGPAYHEAAMDVPLCPIEDRAYLKPVADFLKGQPLDRRAGNDEAVKAFGADIAPRPIEGCQMIRRGVAGDLIRDPHKRQFDLERRRPEQPSKLGFCADLVRHQVKQADA